MSYEPVKRFGRNLVGLDIVVGDVHGCFKKLQVALDEIGFDGARDRLFSVGDLVDRGPDSDMALEWLAKPWFHAVAGNHEQMAIDYVYGGQSTDNYIANGGAWNLSNPHYLQQQIADEFTVLPIAIEIETSAGLVGIVHAECPTHEWAEMVTGLKSEIADERAYMRDACLWGRKRFELGIAQGKAYPVGGIRAVISGHTVVRTPTWLANSLMIDTGGWHKGAFTLIDLDSLTELKLPPWRVSTKPRDLSVFGHVETI